MSVAMYRPTLNVEGIPESLRELPQWVGWTFGERNGKPTKIPINARTGTYASTTDPSTWSTFEAALARYQNDDQVAGIGFVFTKDAGIVGIDLDHCRNPDGGELEPWARIIVQGVDTFTEVSQSGTGLHLYAYAKMPADGNKRTTKSENGEVGGIEAYAVGRFFTVTGEHLLGTPTVIEARQNPLDNLYRE